MTLFELVYPELCDQIRACGAGTFVQDEVRPDPKTHSRSNDFSMIHVGLRYHFNDGMLLRLETRNHLTGSRPTYIIRRSLAVYHYGADQRDITNTHFRVCINKIEPPHVHIAGHADHIPIDKVSPNMRDRDPREFVRLVDDFRRTGKLPLKRVRP